MIELIVKKETVRPNTGSSFWQLLLFYGSILIFFLTLAGYWGVVLLNSNQQKTKTRLIEEIKLKEEGLRSELLDEIFLLDERLRNMSTLLNRHIFTSNLFKLLETDVHPQVRFISFGLTTNSKKMDMNGEAANYAALAKQISILERNPQIEKIDFGGLSSGANNFINFKTTITFRQGILLIRP